MKISGTETIRTKIQPSTIQGELSNLSVRVISVNTALQLNFFFIFVALYLLNDDKY